MIRTISLVLEQTVEYEDTRWTYEHVHMYLLEVPEQI